MQRKRLRGRDLAIERVVAGAGRGGAKEVCGVIDYEEFVCWRQGGRSA